MSVSSTSVTVLGTARPWKFVGDGSTHYGATNANVGYGLGYYDGSTAGGTGVLNATYTYGYHHAMAGETNPHTVAVTAGQRIILKYVSGTVTAFSGDSAHGPTGQASAPPGPYYTDSTPGVVYPIDWVSGLGTTYTARSGLLGCFTDSLGAIIVISGTPQTFDWKSKGGTDSANSEINLLVPVGATLLSLGIMDDELQDNGGSFSVSVVQFTVANEVSGYAGGLSGGIPPWRVPPVQMGIAANFDVGFDSRLLATVYGGRGSPAFDLRTLGFMAGKNGQLFPTSSVTISSNQGQKF